MKIIFLDVDGVLNHSGCPEWKQGDWRVIDDACVERIRSVCTATGARIVLSSTWRVDPEAVEIIRGCFGELLVDVTPQSSYHARHKEIREWLDLHPEVTRFVVIDDDADAEVVGHPFVRTSFIEGLTESLAAVAWLALI